MDTWGNLPEDERERIARGAQGRRGADAVSERIRVDEHGRLRFRTGEQEVTLMNPDLVTPVFELGEADLANAVAVDTTAEPLTPYWTALDPLMTAVLPWDRADHRPRQSPVRHQGSRSTCTAHAALALLEGRPEVIDDLSEQLGYYRYCEAAGIDHTYDDGVHLADFARSLASPGGRVCPEHLWPYVGEYEDVVAAVHGGRYAPPDEAVAEAGWGYRDYKLIGDEGLEGESIKNVRYLETLIAEGLDVVVDTWVSWDDQENDGVLDPVLTPDGAPAGEAAHAMLIVGYDRPRERLIVKNSWGTEWGHGGYGYFSYAFARACFRCGFTVAGTTRPNWDELTL